MNENERKTEWNSFVCKVCWIVCKWSVHRLHAGQMESDGKVAEVVCVCVCEIDLEQKWEPESNMIRKQIE